MKKTTGSLVTLTLTLTLVCLCLSSSPASARSWEIGAKGGVNFTSFAMSPRQVSTSADGQLVAGGFVNYRFRERLALGAELLYAEHAVTVDEVGLDARLDARALLVPVPLHVALGPPDGTHIFLSGGVQWTSIGRTVETIEGVERVDEGGRDWDFGLLAGGGVRVPLRRGALSFEARYVWGLRDLDEDDDSVKLRTFYLLAGYHF